MMRQPGVQQQLLQKVDGQTRSLTQLVATGRWDEAVLVSRAQDQALVQLLSRPIDADEREHARRSLGAVLESVSRLLVSLEQARAQCAARLKQIQQARRAAQSYGQYRVAAR